MVRHGSRRGAGTTGGGEVQRKEATPGRQTLADLAMRQVAESAAAQGRDPTVNDVASAAIEGKGAGSPVPAGVRGVAESHLGADLSDVRVHTDEAAGARTQAMGARAFAYHRDVFLAPGESAGDVQLMTHELTHVVQQGAAGPAVQRKVEVAPSNHPAEAEADAVAAQAAKGARPDGAIVEDGQEAQPGQLTKSAMIERLAQAAESEIGAAPPESQAGLRRELAQQLADYRSKDARALETALASASGAGRARNAEAYVAGARARMRDQAAATSSAAPATAAAAVAQMGPSQSIDGAAAKAAEGPLGESLGHVEVHTGPAAARFAAQHDATAVAVGDHIAFGAGQYQPGTPHGDALIAHELAHVVQTKGADPDAPLARSDAAAEDHADDAAAAAVAARHAPGESTVQPASPGVLKRPMSLSRCDGAERRRIEAQARALATELQTLIAGAHWKGPGGIRERVYPRESAAGIRRAKERKQGARPDLTGLGQIRTLEHFAGAIRALQGTWSAKTPQVRTTDIGAAVSAEMTAAGVPRFLNVVSEPMEWKGFFTAGDWVFHISQDMVNAAALNDADAAEVCNTALHEARHAEQAFLGARFKAGPPDNLIDPTALAGDTGIPVAIAREAVRVKFDARTDPTVAALGRQMYQANVTDGAANQRISDDDGMREMETAKRDAQAALTALQAAPSAATIASATTKRDALRAAITVVEQRYTLYRNIPYEADAHEVGDAAEQAFRGWP